MSGYFCLRFDIDTIHTPWRVANWVNHFGEKGIELIPSLLEQSKNNKCPIHFFALGFGAIEYPELLHTIASTGLPLDSHLHTHRVTLIDEYSLIYEELITAGTLLRNMGLNIEGVGATGMYLNGIEEREDVQRLLIDKEYAWVSSLWNPSRGLEEMQPYRYPDGLLEIPCAGWSDFTFFHSTDRIEVLPEYQTKNRNLSSFIGHVQFLIRKASEYNLFYCIDLHPAVIANQDPEQIFLPTVAKEAHDNGVKIVTMRDIASILTN